MDIDPSADASSVTAPGDAAHPVGQAAGTVHRQTATQGAALSRRMQAIVLGAVAMAAVAAAFAWPAVMDAIRPKPAAEAAEVLLAGGAFKPSAAQWANLKIAPVRQQRFRATQQTDGKIALDDDVTTQVFSPLSGRVTKLYVRAGDMVQAGAPLVAIEASEFVQGQNDLVSAIAALATARAQLRLSQTSERRQHDLFLANGGALKDWQQSQLDLATAQGGLNSAEIALGAVRNRLRILGKTDKEIADLEAATNALRFSPSSVVVAPVSGTVIQRQVGLGQYVVNQSYGASTPVFTIGDLSRIWLVANVREADGPLVHVGDPVEVKVPAFPDRVFNARVVYVAAALDPNTHRLPVRAEIDNADGALKPEMFAAFSIITGQDSAAPAVPESAVVYEGEAAHVFVADPEAKTISIRQVRVGRVTTSGVEILGGLKVGEQVVTSGALFIDRAAQDE